MTVETDGFDREAVAAFQPDAKIALLATKDSNGLPRLSLITSLAAKNPSTLTFGQFCEGRSKENLRSRPEAGFLVMTKDRRIWRGTATWKNALRQGEDFEAYNRRPMFRYNAYFGIHTVHFLRLREVSGPRRPNAAELMTAASGGLLAHALRRRETPGQALTPWAARLLTRPTTLKFGAWVADDGYPRIAPLLPLAAGPSCLGVAARGFGSELEPVASGTPVAVLGLNLRMESVLARGMIGPRQGPPGLRGRSLSIDYVYNSMPPKHGQIYPPVPLRAIEQF